MIYTFGPCELDPQRHLLRRAGQPVHLRPKAFAVLIYLLQHRDRVVPKEELCAEVWPAQSISDATLGSTLRTVRHAIGDHGESARLIQTVHGYGYRCVVPVTVHTAMRVALVPQPAEDGEACPTSSTLPAALPITNRGFTPGERKVVTVLCGVLDIASTGHGRPDIEAHDTLMQRFYAHVQDAVQQYGGTLQPPLGDRVLAVFGAPRAQEDHAVRAGMAALALWQRLDTVRDPIGEPAPVRWAMRLGLHTGPMAIGSLSEVPERLTALIGDVTAQAVALQGQAAPGTILCSAATARLLRGQIHCTPVGPVILPSQETPAHAYTLHRGTPRPVWSGLPPERVLSPFVGREREIGILHALLGHAEAGRGQVVGVVGEAGMGKSRLVVEFCRRLAGRQLTLLTGRCLSYSTTTPYLPVLELLRHACGLTETAPPEVIMPKVHTYLHTVGLDLETWAPLLGHLLGLWEMPSALAGLSTEARKAQIVALLTQLWLQASRQSPLLLVLEDLHWSDPSSEAWLDTLVERMVGAPLLVLGTYRPGYHPRWLDKSYITQVALAPLTVPESCRVLQAVLPPAEQTALLVSRLLATAEGNPFFLEELARTVVEQGTEGTVPTVPETIQAVLLARLDRLPVTAKRVLQAAAVMGENVTASLLQAITEVPAEVLQRDLTHLQAAEFLYETRLVPEPHYTFKHVLTRDVTYQSLLRQTRQQYHARLAQALEVQSPAVAITQPEILAHHYTEAGYAAQAWPYWQRAGERAVQRSASQEAVQHLTTALALLSMLPETAARVQQELALQLALGPALMAAKSQAAPEVEQTYARARVLCQHLGAAPQLFPTLRGLCQFYRSRAELRTARELGEQLSQLAQRAAAPLSLLEAHDALGSTLLYLGEYATARRHLEQGIALIDSAAQRTLAAHDDMAPGMRCLSYAALTWWCLGYPTQAVRRSQEALALARELGHLYSLATAHHFTAWLYYYRREPWAVQRQAEALVTLATAQGFPLVAGFGTCYQGWALAMQGQSPAGSTQLRQGMEAVRAMGHTLSRPIWLALLAEVVGYGGGVAEGLSLLAEARTGLEAHAQCDMLAEVYRLEGVLLLRQAVPDVGQAEACFQRALAIARRQQAKSWELRAALSLSQLWQHQGARAKAYELLAPIYGWFTEGFDTADLQEAKAMLAELGC